LGRRVYQLVKAGSLAWSIGYTVPKGGKRKGKGVTELTGVDLIEVSAVTTPANEGTRTLSIKAEQPVQLVSFEL
jgi:HK97 family phage prohead protease